MLPDQVAGTGAGDSTYQRAHARMVNGRADQRATSSADRTSDQSIALTRRPIASGKRKRPGNRKRARKIPARMHEL